MMMFVVLLVCEELLIMRCKDMLIFKSGIIFLILEEDKEIRKVVVIDFDVKLFEDLNIKLVFFSELKKKKKMGCLIKVDFKIDIYICMCFDVVEKFKVFGLKW